MSREIPLTNSDKVAIIDAADYEQVSQHRWFLKHNGKGKYYVARGVRQGKKVICIYLHRFIMQPNDGQDVHHGKNGKLDCTRENLECIEHTNHGIQYYGAEAKAADEYADRHCTEQEWNDR